MKNILRNALIALFTCSSSAFAAETVASNDGGFLLILFGGFFALIIVSQLVPATILFFGMLKGLFQRDHKEEKHLS